MRISHSVLVYIIYHELSSTFKSTVCLKQRVLPVGGVIY